MGERLVVIGGDAGGMTAATQARRLDGDLDIVALEKGSWVSYSACGIPYLVAGDLERVEELVARTPQEFRDNHRIDVRLRHEAMAIDTDARQVEVRDHEHGRTVRIPYDQLVVATGASPYRPDVPGINGETVLGVQTLTDAQRLLDRNRRGLPRDVVVVGGGYIGLEMAETYVRLGATVTIVDQAPEIMGTLDPDMAALVRTAMVRHGIEVRCGTAVTAFEPGAVHLANGDTLTADLVVLGTGVAPNSRAGGRRRRRDRASRAPSGSTPASRRAPTASGRPGTAPSPTTWCPGSRCTSRWAPSPTGRPGWPASTWAAATPPSRAWSARR